MKKNNIQKLYRWQSECIEAWEAAVCRGIVNAVTGSGKTRLAIAAAARLSERYPDLRIRIVAPTIALANQWRQAIIRTKEFAGITTGFYGDGIRDDGDFRIMIYVINSARQGLQKHIRSDFALNKHVLLICDECHRYKSEHNRRIFSFIDRNLDELPLYHCLGLSATPFNGDRDDILTNVLGPEIYSYDLSRAAKDETIAPYTVCQVATDFMEEEEKKYRELSDAISAAYGKLVREHSYLKNLDKDQFIREVTKMARAADMDPEDPAAEFLLLTYRRKEVSVLAEARIRCCIELVSILKKRGRMLIFSERIEQAEKIYSIISRQYGSLAGLYHSGMTRDARTRVLEDYRENRIRILVSCRCLDEGLDVPDAAVGIVVSGSSVPRQRIQRLGRIVRNSEGKESACLYYIYLRGSNDDQAYLQAADGESPEDNTFDLRFFSKEGVFSNDLYEYAAGQLLGKASEKKYGVEHMAELRRCILEGLCLPDYLADDKILSRHIRNAKNTHEKNYYRVMKSIHSCFVKEE